MEERATYTLTPSVETAFKALAIKSAAEIGYTLTQEQVLALAYELAHELPGSPAAVSRVVAAFCVEIVYDLENEHPVHTWARWAADVENDQTPPGQGYTEYVADRHHTGTVGISGQQYTADAPTLAGLEAYFSPKTNRLKPHLAQEQFDTFVQHRIAEGRMQPVAPAVAA